MAKKKHIQQPPHVLIFVEGDTDEVFIKTLVDYYASVSSSPLLPYDICNLKGMNGYQKMLDLYSKAHRTYKKGYETRELINALDMRTIRNKQQDVLAPLEEALGVAL